MSASVLKTTANLKSPEFEKNSRRIVDLLTKIKNEEEQIRQGGGAKAIESQHKKGRLTARERIAKLIDQGSQFFELGIYAAFEMYEEWGGASGAGTVTGLAKVCGRTFMVIANDATVKAGAFFPMTAKKVIRAQNIAIENRQRGHERHGHSADYRHHGYVRRWWRVPSRDVRPHFDDRGLGTILGRTRAGSGSNRAKNFGGGFGRSKNARANQRHGGFPRAR